MSKNQKQRKKLVHLLKELFQLNEPELDFGLYRIMHAKAGQVTKFLEEDLMAIISDAFGDADQMQIEKAQAAYGAARKNAQDFGLKGSAVDESVPVKRAQKELDQALNADSQEGEVYEHLYRFFERYYDSGDFMSRRYFARETDAKAAPYSVPYDGREVYLHWANKDQYYIKSSEHLSHFTFHLSQSEDVPDGLRAMMGDDRFTIECRVVDGTEGEHSNVKASDDTERKFMLHDDMPLLLEDGPDGTRRLVLQFEFKQLPGKKYPMDEVREKELKSKYKARKKGDLPLLDMSDKVLAAIPAEAELYKQALEAVVGTDAVKERPLLAKYLRKYMARNTMDYFIHKDLGGFMRRELDFYIKNEIVRLDDVDSADVADVQDYLKRIQVLRRIARPVIKFLAQLEDFQKKLWLKKKFVTETQYCITLDRVPKEYYPEIAKNEDQRQEWVKLFAIDQLKGFSEPLSIEFLTENKFLVLDTKFYPTIKQNIAPSDDDLNGVLFHSENSQSIAVLSRKYQQQIDTLYFDPPYNTDAAPILYKNGYRSSTWNSMMQERIRASYSLLKPTGVLCATVDDYQQKELATIIEEIYGTKNVLGQITIRINPSGRVKQRGFAQSHEYGIFSGKSNLAKIEKIARSEKQLSRFDQEDEEGIFEWRNFRREGSASERTSRPRRHFPIYVSRGKLRIPRMNWSDSERSYFDIESPRKNEKAVWPIDSNGGERVWRWGVDRILSQNSQIEARVNNKDVLNIYYRYRPNEEGILPNSIWSDKKYSATEYGTAILKKMFGNRNNFDFPKSIHAVEDCLRISGMHKKNGICFDAFGGSGTTGHAVINLNKADSGNRKYILVEMGQHFEQALKPRVLKSVYSDEWKEGVPASRNGHSHSLKYVRLESYEDCLNNLKLNVPLDISGADPDFRTDYMLSYMLDFETKGSPSLLNIKAFDDPDNYLMMIKKPGSEEAVETRIDLIETFNWLIGLHVEHIDVWGNYSADFAREIDPELPKDGETRLRVKNKLSRSDNGEFAFRKITGFILGEPGNTETKRPVMVIWRKLTGDLEKDNAALEAWFERERSHRDSFNFRDIYVNGSCNLENLKEPADKWRVHLLEEVFHKAMWDVEN